MILDKPSSSYEETFLKMVKEYSSVPGIMSIEKDSWNGVYIAVLVDSKYFKPESIPTLYENCFTRVFATYELRQQLQDQLDELKIMYPYTNNCVDNYFNKEIEKLNLIIKNYESK